MKLTGIHSLGAPRQVVWDMLMDPDQLVKITPGITRLEKIEDTQYKAIADVKIGPVKGSFKGDLTLLELNAPESFTLKVKQESKIGNVTADIRIHLNSIDEGTTEISFDGDAQMSGLLARTGQRVVSGVANTLTRQFFDAFDSEIEKLNS